MCIYHRPNVTVSFNYKSVHPSVSHPVRRTCFADGSLQATTRQYRTRNLIEGQSGNRNGIVLLSYSLDMPLLLHVRSVLRVRGPLDLATTPPILPHYLPTLFLLLPSTRRRVCTSPFSIIVIRRSVRVLVAIAPVQVRIMVRVAALTSISAAEDRWLDPPSECCRKHVSISGPSRPNTK